MDSLTPEAFEWLRAHHGIISTSKLLEVGVSRRSISSLVRSKVLISLHKGVFRIASALDSVLARCTALSLAHPGGFITGPTAGRLMGLRRMPREHMIHFSVPHGRHLDVSGVKFRQSRKVEATDMHERRDGVRLASPWRLAFDLAADLAPAEHASVIEQILHERLCGIGALIGTAKRLACPTRPGSALFVRNLADRVPGGPLESDPEVRVAKALRKRGIPIVAQTTWLELPNGTKARLDLSVPDIRWGLEVDVHPSHLLLEGTTRDKRRDRQARMIGWQIDRVTALDLLDLRTTIDELVALYATRRDEIGRLQQSPA